MSYGRVALAGLVAAGLAAAAGSRDWFRLPVDFGSQGRPVVAGDLGVDQPLALALGLVLLACWGVVFVTRGAVRRMLAWLGLVTAVSYAASVVAAPFQLPDVLRRQSGIDDVGAVPTAWLVVAAVAGIGVVLVQVLAVRGVRSWPEMGSRYDAPGSRPTDERDLWRALDEGHDPTA